MVSPWILLVVVLGPLPSKVLPSPGLLGLLALTFFMTATATGLGYAGLRLR
jgi:hypothetical protein